jgi:hypothetical protein
MNKERLIFNGCLVSTLLLLTFCSDTTTIDDAMDDSEVLDFTHDDTLLEDTVLYDDDSVGYDDGEYDPDMAGDGGNGCDQNIPNLTTLALEYCSTTFAGSCLFSSCDDCQVCYVDVSCGIPDSSVEPRPCGCYGTGRCYTLCSSSEDCAENESCINLGWFGSSDASCAQITRVCWPEFEPDPPYVCP